MQQGITEKKKKKEKKERRKEEGKEGKKTDTKEGINKGGRTRRKERGRK